MIQINLWTKRIITLILIIAFYSCTDIDDKIQIRTVNINITFVKQLDTINKTP